MSWAGRTGQEHSKRARHDCLTFRGLPAQAILASGAMRQACMPCLASRRKHASPACCHRRLALPGHTLLKAALQSARMPALPFRTVHVQQVTLRRPPPAAPAPA